MLRRPVMDFRFGCGYFRYSAAVETGVSARENP